jgi:hypothetical protein
MPFEDWQLSQVMGKKSKLLEDLIPLQKEENMFIIKSVEQIKNEDIETQESARDMEEIFDIIEVWLEKATKNINCQFAKYEVFEYTSGITDPNVNVIGPVFTYIYKRGY